jgi:hypothetical protein
LIDLIISHLVDAFSYHEATMRTPSYDPVELERQIGPRDGSTAVNSANRAVVQNWLVASGVSSARAKAMKLETLT